MAFRPNSHRWLVIAAPAIIWVSLSAKASSSVRAGLAWGKAFKNAATFSGSLSYTYFSVPPASVSPLHMP